MVLFAWSWIVDYSNVVLTGSRVSPVTSLVMITMITTGKICCLYYNQNKHSSQYSTVVEQRLEHSDVNLTNIDI